MLCNLKCGDFRKSPSHVYAKRSTFFARFFRVPIIIVIMIPIHSISFLALTLLPILYYIQVARPAALVAGQHTNLNSSTRAAHNIGKILCVLQIRWSVLRVVFNLYQSVSMRLSASVAQAACCQPICARYYGNMNWICAVIWSEFTQLYRTGIVEQILK